MIKKFLKARYRFYQYLYFRYKYGLKSNISSRDLNDIKIIDALSLKLAKRNVLVKKKPKGELNIFFAGTNYSQDYSGFIQNLKKFGNVVTFSNEKNEYGVSLPRFLLDNEIIESNSRALIKQVVEEHNKREIDFFLCQLLSNYVKVDTLKEIQKLGIPVLNISLDDLWLKNWERYKGYQLGAIGLIDGVDLTIVSTKEVVDWYSSHNALAIYQPMAGDPEIFYPRLEKKYDVSFIGGNYGLRSKIVKRIAEKGINITTYGPGWQNGALEFDKMAEVFGQSKIILGVGYAGYNKDITTLKNRDFDAPMAGALYITSRNSLLAELYNENKEIVFYNNAKECAEKMKYYLSNTDKLNEIAVAGHKRALKYHTWEKRLEDVLKKLGFII